MSAGFMFPDLEGLLASAVVQPPHAKASNIL